MYIIYIYNYTHTNYWGRKPKNLIGRVTTLYSLSYVISTCIAVNHWVHVPYVECALQIACVISNRTRPRLQLKQPIGSISAETVCVCSRTWFTCKITSVPTINQRRTPFDHPREQTDHPKARSQDALANVLPLWLVLMWWRSGELQGYKHWMGTGSSKKNDRNDACWYINHKHSS